MLFNESLCQRTVLYSREIGEGQREGEMWGGTEGTHLCLVHCCLSRGNLQALAMPWYFEEYNTRLNKTSPLFLRTPLWFWAAVARRWENVFMSTSQRWSATACKPLSLEPDPRNGAALQEKLKKRQLQQDRCIISAICLLWRKNTPAEDFNSQTDLELRLVWLRNREKLRLMQTLVPQIHKQGIH